MALILFLVSTFVQSTSAGTLPKNCEPPASCASPSSLLQKNIGTHQKETTLEEDQTSTKRVGEHIATAKTVINRAIQKRKHTNRNVCPTDNTAEGQMHGCEQFLDGPMGSSERWNYCFEPTAAVCYGESCVLSDAIDNHQWMLRNCAKTCCENSVSWCGWGKPDGVNVDSCAQPLDNKLNFDECAALCAACDTCVAIRFASDNQKCYLKKSLNQRVTTYDEVRTDNWGTYINSRESDCAHQQENGPTCSTDNTAEGESYGCEQYLDGPMGSKEKWNYCLEPTAAVCYGETCVLSQAIENHHWMLSNCAKTCCEWEQGDAPDPLPQTTESPTLTPTKSTEPCSDDPAWEDPVFPGFGCAAWEPYPCDQSQTWGHTADQQKELIKNCPKACEACP